MRALIAAALLCAACGFQASRNDAGIDGGTGDGSSDGGGGCGPPGGVLASCSNTKARGLEPLGPAGAQAINAGLAPAGAKVAAVWEVAGATRSDPGELHFALVDNLGAVGSSKLLVGGLDPVLMRVNDQLTLFWRDGTTLFMQLLDDTGNLLNQPRTVLTGTSESFAVAWNGGEYGVLLSGANGDEYQIYWLRLSESGVIAGGPTKLAESGVNSLQPALAWTGCEYAAAWTDTRPGTPAVFFARFDDKFARKSPDLQLSAMGVRGSFPSLAAQQTGGVVACYQQLMSGNQDIFCSRLDGGGSVTRTTRLSTTRDPSQNPHVVAHGQNTWVLWDDYRSTEVTPDVVWQFLDGDGAPILTTPRFDPDLSGGGWRAHGLVTSDALYFIQYHGDPQSGAFTAEIATENCY